MDDSYYRKSETLREYYESLPPAIKYRILRTDVKISTLGELQQIAEHFMHT